MLVWVRPPSFVGSPARLSALLAGCGNNVRGTERQGRAELNFRMGQIQKIDRVRAPWATRFASWVQRSRAMLLQSTIGKTALMIETRCSETVARRGNDGAGAGQLHMSRRRAPMSTGAVGRNGIASAAQCGAAVRRVKSPRTSAESVNAAVAEATIIIEHLGLHHPGPRKANPRRSSGCTGGAIHRSLLRQLCSDTDAEYRLRRYARSGRARCQGRDRRSGDARNGLMAGWSNE
jgi:hypothetical protein